MAKSASSATVSPRNPPTRRTASRRQAPTAPGTTGRAPHLLLHHVLHRLHAANAGRQVADLRGSSDGSHARIGKGFDEAAHGVGIEEGITVERDHNRSVGGGEATLESHSLALVALADQHHAGLVAVAALDDVTSSIGGA